MISPLFWDEAATINGVMKTNLTIRSLAFALERGRPGEPKVDWTAAPGPARLVLLLDQITRFLAPYANASHMASIEPNLSTELYYSAYPEGVRVPGLVINNRSNEPVWVEGVVVNSAGSYTRQVPVDSELGGFVPPVVGPGESRTLHLSPADVIATLPISPYVDVTLFLSADGRQLTVDTQISSGEALEGISP
jgi:hypothetical protein